MTALNPEDPQEQQAPLDHGEATAGEPAPPTPAAPPLGGEEEAWPQGMIPGRRRRRTGVERVAMRLLATGGIIGVAVILGAVLVAQDVAGWIVGLVVGLTSVTLAAVLWSSKQL